MNIAVNARTLKAVPDDGIGWFTYEVVRGIVKAHPEHRFFLITDRKHDVLPVEGDNVEYITVGPRTVHPLLWYQWHEFILPGVLRRCHADLLFAPDGIIPLRTDVPSVPVIHDLNHEHRPGDIPACERRYYRYFFPRIARRASMIATVSEFSAADIAGTYGISRDKIDVVPNGVADIFSPPQPGEAEETRKEYTGGRPYFLFVSNFSPRKNIETVIKAYDLFRNESESGSGNGKGNESESESDSGNAGGAGNVYGTGSGKVAWDGSLYGAGSDHVLLLAGRRLYLTGRIEKCLKESPYAKDILFTGSVTRDVLRRLYGGAEALVFVPWFEGFGIPVVEAQRCGAPCILSDVSSLPGVSGGAALCVSPADAGAVASAMARLVTDGTLRRRLSLEGRENSLRYTWERAAIEMWNCISKTINL